MTIKNFRDTDLHKMKGMTCVIENDHLDLLWEGKPTEIPFHLLEADIHYFTLEDFHSADFNCKGVVEFVIYTPYAYQK